MTPGQLVGQAQGATAHRVYQSISCKRYRLTYGQSDKEELGEQEKEMLRESSCGEKSWDYNCKSN